MLLTGGGSTRLGVDKATAVVHGRTLAARAAAVLGAVCPRAVEVGPGVSELDAVREEPAGSGPLAALVAGARALGAADSGVVLLACDLPGVGAELLDLVASWPGAHSAVPVAGGRLQLVCARYAPDALAAAANLLAAGERSLHAVLDATPHDRLEPDVWQAVGPPDAFADVDTPADLARVRGGPGRGAL